MNWVTKTDLKKWVGTRDCQENLPKILRMILRAVTTRIEVLSFPSGDNIHHSGLDGYLELNEVVENIPEGKSVWEIGTEESISAKAEYEYNNRLKSPKGFDPKKTTFVFVTPRLWSNRKDWIEEKNKENKWKEVRVINSEVLEQWLELTPTVAQYLAYTYFKKPVEATQSTESYWQNWSTSEAQNIRLTHKIILDGRETDIEHLINRSKAPGVITINSRSKTESIAFIIASFLESEELKESFFARSIIIDDAQTFRDFSNTENSLFLIPRFAEIDSEFNNAVNQGHVVIVPKGTGINKESSQDEIQLRELDRDSFVKNLSDSGFTKDQAEAYSKETARNLTILRRQLKLNRNLPDWATPDKANEIIPALIVGKWDEKVEYDVKIIEQLAGEEHKDYSKKLVKWLNSNNSPFIKIGSVWRIESPLDSWENASQYLTKSDFETLKNSFLSIWREVDPAFELDPEQRFMADYLGKKKQYSHHIKTGISQSLILISLYADKLEYNIGINGEQWVDGIVRELLDSNDQWFWKTIASQLPLISEASPHAFLSILEEKIAEDSSAILSLFDEDPGLIMGNISYHSGLLWALENLAWDSNLLARVSVVLCFLTENDPGGNLSNRPFNSLKEIFMPWHYQTLADFNSRKAILELISTKYPAVAWDLFLSLLPNHHQIGSYTHKPRWRMFEIDLRPNYTNKERSEMYTFLISKLIKLFDYSEEKLEILLEYSTNLSYWDRDALLIFIQSTIEKVSHENNLVWNKTRKILSQHRSHPNQNWSIPEEGLLKYEELYEKLQPTGIVDSTTWMFNERWLSFKEGFEKDSYTVDQKQDIINQRRFDALNSIYNDNGIEDIKKLISLVSEQRIIGKTLASIVSNREEIVELLVEDNEPDFDFAAGFIMGLFEHHKHDHEPLFSLYNDLESIGVSNDLLIRIFIYVKQEAHVWEFIESKGEALKELYWKTINGWFSLDDSSLAETAIKNFLEYECYEPAIDIAERYKKDLSSSILIEVLVNHGKAGKSINRSHLSYEIKELIKELDLRTDYDEKELVNIEVYYLNILTGNYSERGPIKLHTELAKDPEFFNQMLCYAYPPKDEEMLEREKEEFTTEGRKNAARNSSTLLESWKAIPGIKSAEEIDEEYLLEWVRKTRELAVTNSREKGFDIVVGKLLSNYPKVDDHIPPDVICGIIESINTKTIKGCFRAAMHNLNSSSTRSPYDGGDIERAKANYYYKISKALGNRFPIVSEIFLTIGKGFEDDSRREDDKGRMTRLDY